MTQPTTTALARKFKLDVNTGTFEAPTWTPVRGITDFNPNVEPTLQESSDYDTDGWVGQEKTMQAFTAEVTVMRKKYGGAQDYDAGQEAIRYAHDKFGEDARVDVRYYDRDGGPEAYRAVCLVGWARANSGVADLDAATITLTGDGARTDIANPLA